MHADIHARQKCEQGTFTVTFQREGCGTDSTGEFSIAAEGTEWHWPAGWAEPSPEREAAEPGAASAGGALGCSVRPLSISQERDQQVVVAVPAAGGGGRMGPGAAEGCATAEGKEICRGVEVEGKLELAGGEVAWCNGTVTR